MFLHVKTFRHLFLKCCHFFCFYLDAPITDSFCSATRFSSVVATRGIRRITWEHKEKLREELKHAKGLTRAIKEERARAKQDLRDRRQENLKRQEANARKAEIVQVVRSFIHIFFRAYPCFLCHF